MPTVSGFIMMILAFRVITVAVLTLWLWIGLGASQALSGTGGLGIGIGVAMLGVALLTLAFSRAERGFWAALSISFMAAFLAVGGIGQLPRGMGGIQVVHVDRAGVVTDQFVWNDAQSNAVQPTIRSAWTDLPAVYATDTGLNAVGRAAFSPVDQGLSSVLEAAE